MNKVINNSAFYPFSSNQCISQFFYILHNFSLGIFLSIMLPGFLRGFVFSAFIENKNGNKNKTFCASSYYIAFPLSWGSAVWLLSFFQFRRTNMSCVLTRLTCLSRRWTEYFRLICPPRFCRTNDVSLDIS
jgi:hypothetical protein